MDPIPSSPDQSRASHPFACFGRYSCLFTKSWRIRLRTLELLGAHISQDTMPVHIALAGLRLAQTHLLSVQLPIQPRHEMIIRQQFDRLRGLCAIHGQPRKATIVPTVPQEAFKTRVAVDLSFCHHESGSSAATYAAA